MRIKHPREHGLVVARGGAVDPTTLALGTTGQVLTAVTGADPAFAAPATVSLTTGVSGVLPLANGGTGSAVGALAIMQFIGAAVPAGSTIFLGRTSSATAADVGLPCPLTTGTIVQYVTLATAGPGGTDTFTYRLRVNGTPVGTQAVATGATTSVLITTQSLAVVFGDVLDVRLITSAGAVVTNHMVTLAIRVNG